MRTLAGHYITVPNAKVAEALIHNMKQPNPVRRHAVNVGASYSDAPDEVHRGPAGRGPQRARRCARTRRPRR